MKVAHRTTRTLSSLIATTPFLITICSTFYTIEPGRYMPMELEPIAYIDTFGDDNHHNFQDHHLGQYVYEGMSPDLLHEIGWMERVNSFVDWYWNKRQKWHKMTRKIAFWREKEPDWSDGLSQYKTAKQQAGRVKELIKLRKKKIEEQILQHKILRMMQGPDMSKMDYTAL